jgi:hypothetical protein
MALQILTIIKSDNTATATFPQKFANSPVVLVTPVYTEPVRVVDYLTSVTSADCIIRSSNAAANYMVNILAADAGAGLFGTLKFIAGIHSKAIQEIDIDIRKGKLSSPDPVTIISANWASGEGDLGSPDFLNDSAASEISVESPNMSADYQISYISADIGIGEQDGKVMQTGIANKTGLGTLRVYFSQQFSTVPTVFLTPWWHHGGDRLGSVETVLAQHTTVDYFEFSSQNAAANYFVNWMALES